MRVICGVCFTLIMMVFGNIEAPLRSGIPPVNGCRRASSCGRSSFSQTSLINVPQRKRAAEMFMMRGAVTGVRHMARVVGRRQRWICTVEVLGQHRHHRCPDMILELKMLTVQPGLAHWSSL